MLKQMDDRQSGQVHIRTLNAHRISLAITNDDFSTRVGVSGGEENPDCGLEKFEM
jgi:hypothetical protein